MKKIVVKVGSNLLVKEDGTIDKEYMIELARTMAEFWHVGDRVVLVTSGAKAAGYGLALRVEVDQDLYIKQALCAIGQVQLMKLYETIFDLYDIKVAQLLINRDDFSNRKRFLNLRNTLIGLLEMGFLPIVNENDTVSTEEISFGDNDVLAAMFAIGWKSDYLFLLSTVDGVIDETGQKISEFNPGTRLKRLHGNGWGTGGIETKIRAARAASAAGVESCICHGKKLTNLRNFILGKNVGTKFRSRQTINSRKAWIGFLSSSSGRVIVNAGAEKALRNSKSLLPIGIVEVCGKFNTGDIVDVISTDNNRVGRGIVNFNSDEIEKIKGIKSDNAKKVLGYDCPTVFIHTDNFWLED
ncbi:glutamate 5-kinase [Kosmotoga pacifica]|uniref:Glutamate 5-kinase n=1 Tax=Kosmotoga pacifica TaxID=1330330 RepID=A0A0G2ZDY8_9BACT|nr:glutamate 5-kinase [Kosmotoga pacifica]AKI97774.1 gamma-glutamyl kinase [Kosmotoga pacifica]